MKIKSHIKAGVANNPLYAGAGTAGNNPLHKGD